MKRTKRIDPKDKVQNVILSGSYTFHYKREFYYLHALDFQALVDICMSYAYHFLHFITG